MAIWWGGCIRISPRSSVGARHRLLLRKQALVYSSWSGHARNQPDHDSSCLCFVVAHIHVLYILSMFLRFVPGNERFCLEKSCFILSNLWVQCNSSMIVYILFHYGRSFSFFGQIRFGYYWGLPLVVFGIAGDIAVFSRLRGAYVARFWPKFTYFL